MNKSILAMISVIALISISFSHANETAMEILLKGRISKDAKTISRVIDDEDQLSVLWKELGQKSVPPKVDFSKESIVFFVSQNSSAEEIAVNKIEQNSDSKIDIVFAAKKNEKSLSGNSGMQSKPYIVGKLAKPGNNQVDIVLSEKADTPPLPVNQGLGEEIRYTNIFSDQKKVDLIDYITLDLGNIWTYNINSEKQNAVITQEVLSVSNGWSVFNSYFGKNNLAMKIEKDGNLLVSTPEGIRSFYTDSIQKTFVNEEFETPAGKFSELLIVTIPKNDQFWFRDVYAKGVGLVYHEHISPNGRGEYTLIKAKVRGREFPG